MQADSPRMLAVRLPYWCVPEGFQPLVMASRRRNMTLRTATAIVLFLFASAPTHASEATAASGAGARRAVSNADAPTITIPRSSLQSSITGSAQYFTGSVHITPLFQAKAPSKVSSARVMFAPGARSAWHTHPLGQTLIVTVGTGWVQQEGGEKQEIKAGGCLLKTAGGKTSPGASSTQSMTHIT